MLSRLSIRNLALVDSLSIEFRPGLNVITGETGAGKSLLIGALRLVLGERADKSMIRTGETSCRIEACFELADARAVDAILDDLGLEPCENGTLIIRRTITGARSQNRVNDAPITLGGLRAIGDVLVDMHGPYDHQSLLKTDAQIDILDAFGDLDAERQRYRQRYRDLLCIEQQLEQLSTADQADLGEQIDLLRWRIQDIEAAQISESDEREIVQEHEQMAHAQNILELAQRIAGGLTEAEFSAFDGLSSARHACTQLEKYIPEASDWADELDSALRTTQEISSVIQDRVRDISAGPDRMQFLDERVALYRNIKRKYAPSVAEILTQLEGWKAKLNDLQTRDEQREKCSAQCAASRKKTQEEGLCLRARRQQAADELARAITAELRDLGFEHGRFEIQLSECAPGPKGVDAIEFGFAPNAGEAMRPLRMIASSGEISRVMLAVKAVLTRHDQIPLLVFDEIDANVGGEIANAVGEKLAQVGGAHQLIAITHLPQVAACGQTHFAVSKRVRGGRTFTNITLLEEQTRTDEIARMLGGKDLTHVTQQHAQELLANRKE